MSDEVDYVQDTLNESIEDGVQLHRRSMRQDAPCTNECGRVAFKMPNGTRTKFCKECWLADHDEENLPPSLRAAFEAEKASQPQKPI